MTDGLEPVASILADAVARWKEWADRSNDTIVYCVLNPSLEPGQALVGRDGDGKRYAMFSTAVLDQMPIVVKRPTLGTLRVYRLSDLPLEWPTVGIGVRPSRD